MEQIRFSAGPIQLPSRNNALITPRSCHGVLVDHVIYYVCVARGALQRPGTNCCPPSWLPIVSYLVGNPSVPSTIYTFLSLCPSFGDLHRLLADRAVLLFSNSFGMLAPQCINMSDQTTLHLRTPLIDSPYAMSMSRLLCRQSPAIMQEFTCYNGSRMRMYPLQFRATWFISASISTAIVQYQFWSVYYSKVTSCQLILHLHDILLHYP